APLAMINWPVPAAPTSTVPLTALASITGALASLILMTTLSVEVGTVPSAQLVPVNQSLEVAPVHVSCPKAGDAASAAEPSTRTRAIAAERNRFCLRDERMDRPP